MKHLSPEQLMAISDLVQEAINELDYAIIENPECVYTDTDRLNYERKKDLASAGLKILRDQTNREPNIY